MSLGVRHFVCEGPDPSYPTPDFDGVSGSCGAAGDADPPEREPRGDEQRDDRDPAPARHPQPRRGVEHDARAVGEREQREDEADEPLAAEEPSR